ncbi:MAG: hypothetical protein NTX50_13105 [Candidatus Sumerlaeota bacterium]|nr:hypothetical protein [Candidatus Sumerlaeota bacterium]
MIAFLLYEVACDMDYCLSYSLVGGGSIVTFLPYALLGRLAPVAVCVLVGFAVMSRRGRIDESVAAACAAALLIVEAYWATFVLARHFVYLLPDINITLFDLFFLGDNPWVFGCDVALILCMILLIHVLARRLNSSDHPAILLFLSALVLGAALAVDIFLPSVAAEYPSLYFRHLFTMDDLSAGIISWIWAVNLGWAVMFLVALLPVCARLVRACGRNLGTEWET